MLAVVKEAPQVGAIAVRDVAPPTPGAGEALISVKATSICGSDLHIWHWDPIFHAVMTTPRVIGHEFAGVVARSADAGVPEGTRVIAESVRYCGACPRCRRGRTSICDNFRVRGVHIDGGMAEQTVIGTNSLHTIPDGLSFEHASVVEPASVATHAVLERSGVRPGDLALVTGPGPIGLLTAQIARAAGAEVVVTGAEVDQEVRLVTAEALGFKTINTARESVNEGLKRVVGRDRADLAIECAGTQGGFESAVQGVEKGGTIVIIALYSGAFPIDPSVAVRRELDLKASYIANWDDYERAIQFIADGTIDVGPLIRTYPLSDAVLAMEHALAKNVMKAVLQVH
ncbi:MAG: alcohol dehydrogenase catalytic domain-containing protein [Chloroflexota bacterium]